MLFFLKILRSTSVPALLVSVVLHLVVFYSLYDLDRVVGPSAAGNVRILVVGAPRPATVGEVSSQPVKSRPERRSVQRKQSAKQFVKQPKKRFSRNSTKKIVTPSPTENESDASGSSASGAATNAGSQGSSQATGSTLGEDGRRQRDLSRPEPVLIGCDKPELTDEAMDAGVFGPFKLEVFVEANGSVKEADLPRPVRFGMDSRLLAAAKTCSFKPALYSSGKAYATWGGVTIKVSQL